MRSKAAALLLLAALVACNREPAPAPTATQAPAPAAPAAPKPDAATNLLSAHNGAAVVSRTGEFSYESSAAHSIDDDGWTQWASPLGGAEQTLVLSLAARSRIRRFGVTNGPGRYAVHSMAIESSDDGIAWKPVATVPFGSEETEIHDVAPFEARYLRIRPAAPNQTFAVIRDFYAYGDVLEPPRTPALEGCWTINGRAARFVRNGAQIQGVIDASDREQAIHLDGGFDGRANHFMWRAAAQFGDAVLVVSPDGKATSGIKRHKGLGTQLGGDGWLGVPGPCAVTALDPDSVRNRALAVVHRYPLYALRFDAQNRVLETESAAALDLLARLNGIKLVARSGAAPLAPLRAALARRVDASRYEFVDGSAETAKLVPGFFPAAIEIETK